MHAPELLPQFRRSGSRRAAQSQPAQTEAASGLLEVPSPSRSLAPRLRPWPMSSQSPSRSRTALCWGEPLSQDELDQVFSELDADNSGQISRKELELAMKKMFGKAMKPKRVDQMMRAADTDSSGDIDLEEFRVIMHACEKERDGAKKLEKTMGLWFSIRERGLQPSKEQKASEDMRKRRLGNEAKRKANLDKALAEVALTNPQDLPTPPRSARPAPLPAGGGLPPRAQVQTPGSPSPSRKRRTPSPGSRKDKDVKIDVMVDIPVDNRSDLVKLWESLPTPSECVMMVLEFVDSYLPIMIMLSIPTSLLVTYISNQWARYRWTSVHPEALAPPPPPMQPDWLAMQATNFYDLAQEEPGAFLLIDLGTGFAIGILALFWKDINEWFEQQRLKAASGSYQKLDGEEAAEEEDKAAVSMKLLQMQLYKAINVMEEARAGPIATAAHVLWVALRLEGVPPPHARARTLQRRVHGAASPLPPREHC